MATSNIVPYDCMWSLTPAFRGRSAKPCYAAGNSATPLQPVKTQKSGEEWANRISGSRYVPPGSRPEQRSIVARSLKKAPCKRPGFSELVVSGALDKLGKQQFVQTSL
ncbi:hypothetical protein SERLA73DRAFT_77958 [Serpula lacrymans var. lacrymans S7.3]|uniref:Uncharacterized protein n=1 Tax=Serpula lacrymans var. lacrymans (strain S7.3) TaxID=936435 RepID=F8QBL0_SERL3|nr:hypothetical protein SERLA73DRAFT_77958 [Serpula lacrymans var. lacrymans S7.3]